MLRRWLPHWQSFRRSNRTRSRSVQRWRPFLGWRLEILEDRWNPAAFTVTTLLDSFDPQDGLLSLREAIFQAAQTSEDDTINFDSNLFASGIGTIQLNSTIAITSVSGAISIQGPGADKLIITGNNIQHFSLFSVDLSIDGVSFRNGFGSNTNGGSIESFGGSLTITNSSFINNSTGGAEPGSGGAIYSSGLLRVQNSTFVGNRGALGGAILVDGSAVIVNSTFSNNLADFDGGALFVGGGALLRNVTIFNNRAGFGFSSGDGGGIAVGAGGFMIPASGVVLHNTIVAGNVNGLGQASDLFGSVDPTSSNNLISDASSSGGLVNGVNGNLVGIDPQLGPIGNNGGTTATHPLAPTSPAIDAGNNAQALDIFDQPLLSDQRGFSRFQNGIVDIGAFEFEPLIDDPVDPVNNPPILQPVPDQFLEAGSVLELQLNAFDPDGDSIQFLLAPGNLPGIMLNPITGQLMWATPSFLRGPFFIKVIVIDDGDPNLTTMGTIRVNLFGEGDLSDGSSLPLFLESGAGVPNGPPDAAGLGPANQAPRLNNREQIGNDRRGFDDPRAQIRNRVPSGPDGRGRRPEPTTVETKLDRAANQITTRSLYEPERNTGSVKPLVTPNAAVSSIFDSDDSVNLIDELRRNPTGSNRPSIVDGPTSFLESPEPPETEQAVIDTESAAPEIIPIWLDRIALDTDAVEETEEPNEALGRLTVWAAVMLTPALALRKSRKSRANFEPYFG